MQNNQIRYKCTYTSGGGTEYSDGIWTRKDTPKTITISKIAELDGHVGVYRMHDVGTKLKVGPRTGNPFNDHFDGTFTIYFMQGGTPYYFEPIT